MHLCKHVLCAALLFCLTAMGSSAQSITESDPAFFSIVAKGAKVEKLAGDLKFTEGPVWSKEGFLLFSDIPANTIYKWQNGKLSEYLKPSGNSNGLAYDKAGDLIACEHGTRSLQKIDAHKKSTVVAASYQGKKLSSPNDLAIKSDGSIYFTDPPFGLPKQDSDSAKELKINGVYRLKDGIVTLLDSSFVRPNGIAFSPDEKYLYVSQSEVQLLWKKFELTKDGLLVNGSVFYDASKLQGKGYADGLKVDVKGNLYCTAPGGIAVFSKEGKFLGTIHFPEITTNCAFGEADKKTLFVTAGTGLYKIRLNIPGI
jgi:gluconolactonase